MHCTIPIVLFGFLVACEARTNSKIRQQMTEEIQMQISDWTDQNGLSTELYNQITAEKNYFIDSSEMDCLFGGEVDGRIDRSQTVAVWQIELIDQEFVSVQIFDGVIPFNISKDTIKKHGGIYPLRFSVISDALSIEIELSMGSKLEEFSGEWYLCRI